MCKPGTGSIRVNGTPLDHLEPAELRVKAFEPILLLGAERFAGVDIVVRAKGGGSVAQLYGNSIYQD